MFVSLILNLLLDLVIIKVAYVCGKHALMAFQLNFTKSFGVS